MNKTLVTLMIFTLSFVSPHWTFAEQAAEEGSGSGSLQTPDRNQYDQARASEGASSGSSGVNTMVSAGLFAGGAACLAATCSTGCAGYCFVLLGMGALAASQAKSAAKDAYDANNLAYDVGIPKYNVTPIDSDGDGIPDINDPFFGLDPNGKVPFGPYGTIGEIQGVMGQNEQFMKENGIRLNPDGSVTFKDGTTLTADQLNSPSSLDGASAEALADYKKVIDKAKSYAGDASKYKVAAMGFDNGGGGGGAAFKFTPYESDFDMSKYLKGLNKNKRGPASVTGMSKRVGGSPIGVSGDNIFAMITRRYQAKTRTNTFIGERKPPHR